MKKAMFVFLLLSVVMVMGILNSGVVAARCYDSDGGKNYMAPGYVKDYNRMYSDKCIKSGVPGVSVYLKEYYCGPRKMYTYQYCRFGCVDGACLSANTVCGDGKKMQNEECDKGANNGNVCTPGYDSSCTYCTANCKLETVKGGYCGDGTVDPGEACDDDNNVNGDGCDADCNTEVVCDEDWSCGAWGDCVVFSISTSYPHSVRHRTCTDANSCGTSNTKPATEMACHCVSAWDWEEDYVNIGDPVSETGYNLLNFGPVEPLTNDGSWGYSNNPLCRRDYGFDGDCRAVSTATTTDSASFRLNMGGTSDDYMLNYIYFYVLEGTTNDSFDVYIDGVKVHEHIDLGYANMYCDGNEDWVQHVIEPSTLLQHFPYNRYSHVGGNRTMKIVSTGQHWSGYGTYGQLGVTEVRSRWLKRSVVCT